VISPGGASKASDQSAALWKFRRPRRPNPISMVASMVASMVRQMQCVIMDLLLPLCFSREGREASQAEAFAKAW